MPLRIAPLSWQSNGLPRCETDELVHLSFTSGAGCQPADGSTANTLIGTAEHPFWSLTRDKWVDMGELNVGEQLSLTSGTATVTAVRVELLSEPVKVYNFQVADWHTYYAAPEADKPFVWVHNANGYGGDNVKRIDVGESGHHVPAVRKSRGRPFEVSRSDKTRPTYHPTGDDPGHAHWRMHDAERAHVGPRQGDFPGTDDELFNAYRKAYQGLDDIRGDLMSPNGEHILGRNVTPRQAVDLMDVWLRNQGKR